MRKIVLVIAMFVLSGCLGMPKGVTPVDEFELENYLGTWYEIARLDHSFEEGLSKVTAEYRLKDDGGVQVINRGFNAQDNEWSQAEGKAYFVNAPDEGYLKVSFFGPFYGSYVVFELDKQQYQYAFVSGPNNDYLWLLARKPTVSSEIRERFVEMSKQRGFDTKALIFVDHD
ncbi:lipocalin family protein [Vibrio sp. SCSIO 43136]|uniref:lipocalin family protein n=1 Tax=Vibrio sp. SCSIO 43136 TaxID=2819101 RepID=UPI0020751292|nr:lipocalin family protein [Vibrio sp. SCSIO 43136]USD66981.1 lipocalin family protein [Vibrio sp. SCSIO 43136]